MSAAVYEERCLDCEIHPCACADVGDLEERLERALAAPAAPAADTTPPTPLLADDLPLTEVLARLGWRREYQPTATVIDAAGNRYVMTAGDVWALLRRRGLITTPSVPCCAKCGFSTGSLEDWTTPQGNRPGRCVWPCRCHMLAELPQ